MTVLTVAEVRSALGMQTDTQDVALAGVLAAAEAVIASRCGPLAVMSVTETVTAGASGLVALPQYPVASVTSGTNAVTGVALDVSSVRLLGAGVVSGVPEGTWSVTWQAGRETLPADLRLAVVELTRHLWATRNGPAARPGSDPGGQVGAWLMPYRVEALIGPYQMPGMG